MKIKFQVVRDGHTIFEKAFPAAVDGRYGDVTALAIAEFQIAHPTILLTDDDVILKWSEVEE